jgi:hypothetical protein
MSDALSNSTPQFGTAEYAGVAGTEHCQFCRQPLGHRYYRLNTGMACAACGERAQHELPKDSHTLFTRGLIFGIGGAILGLIIYALFAITTGLMIGYVSLAVGYIVGRAVKMGSRGAGGRKYQIAAVALTYAAVSLAAVPIYISFYAKNRKAHAAQVQHQPASDTGQTSDAEQAQAPQPRAQRMGVGSALLQLAFVGLASPFVELASDPFHGLIGLVILFVGIRIAWKMAAGTETQIYGPFENAAVSS